MELWPELWKYSMQGGAPIDITGLIPCSGSSYDSRVPVILLGNFMLIDLHIHTTLSDCSTLRLEQIFQGASQRGLDGVCLTDHHSMAAARQIREGVQADGLLVIIGMEYSTPQGDFLLFGPFEALPHGLPASDLLSLVHHFKGVAIAAHPCRQTRPLDETLLRQGLCDLVEGDNGRNSAAENRQGAELASRYPLVLTAGSDAHREDEIGRFATCFSSPVRNRQELISALQKGHCSPWTNPALPQSAA